MSVFPATIRSLALAAWLLASVAPAGAHVPDATSPTAPPAAGAPADAPKPGDAVSITFETTQGSIVIELDAGRAPRTVANFLRYAKEGFYDGTQFHRVIPGFMIQGGGYGNGLQYRATHAPVANESSNGLLNARGTIAMARTSDPDSATSQFFINVADNAFLDYPGSDGSGYTVFGRVVEGMETVDRIVALPTAPKRAFGNDFPNLPKEPVYLKKVRLGN